MRLPDSAVALMVGCLEGFMLEHTEQIWFHIQASGDLRRVADALRTEAAS